MKSVILLIGIIFVSFFNASANSRDVAHLQETKNIIIAGIIRNIESETILIQTYSYYSSYRGLLDAKEYKIETIKNRFKIKLPVDQEYNYISISFKSAINRKKVLHTYLIQSKDSIFIDVTGSEVLLSGKGSELLKCQSEANAIPADYWSKEDAEKYNNFGFDHFVRMNQVLDSIYNRKFEIIKNYFNNNLVSYDEAERLKLDYEGEKMKRMLRIFLFMSGLKDTNTNLTIERNRFYKEYFRDNTFQNIDRQKAVKSRSFSDALLQKIWSDIIYDTLASNNSYPTFAFGKLYNYINTNYENSPLKERLIATSATIYFRGNSSYEGRIIDSLISTFTNTYCKDILLKLQNASLTGVPAYNFTFSDQYGKIVKLTDFKGKIIIIDFWFTGCGPCIAVEKSMKTIRAHFSNSADIVFLSISGDTDKSTWLNSVNKGLYTAKENTNLFIGKQGSNHAIFKYYQYAGCPQLLIINRDQTILNSKPNIPINEAGRESFISFIKKNINGSNTR